MKLDYMLGQDLGQELANPTKYSETLQKLITISLSRKEISEAFGEKRVSGQLNRVLPKLIKDRLIEYTIPKVKNHPDQKFRITKRGMIFLELLKKQV